MRHISTQYTCIIPTLILVCAAGQTGFVSFVTARFTAQFMTLSPSWTPLYQHTHAPLHRTGIAALVLDADLLKTAGRQNSFGQLSNTHRQYTRKQKGKCWADSTASLQKLRPTWKSIDAILELNKVKQKKNHCRLSTAKPHNCSA